MKNKEKYRKFCENEKDIPIFSKAWWLDAVCGIENWDVVLVEKGGEILASMPFLKPKQSLFKILLMPKLTQNLGPYIKYPKEQKYEKKLSFEQNIMTQLIEQLPKYDMFRQAFHYNITNWLPFYWNGYKQHTAYTYVIEDLNDLDLIWSNFNNKTRTNIRKAEKELKVIVSDDLTLFYEINKMTFTRQNIKVPYTLDFLKKIDTTCDKYNCRKIFFAIDEQKQVHAAIYIVWDENSAYYILGGSDPKLRSSGATYILLWEAIKFSSTIVEKFDFEGSMMKPVEKFVKSFGPTQKPYFHIKKVNSKLLKIALFMKEFRK